MVIQRIQTLMILLAIACVATFLVIPFGYWDVDLQKTSVDLIELKASAQPAPLVPAIVALAVMFISIFCFKKMPLQKGLVALSAIIVTAMACVVVYIMTRGFVEPNPAISVAPSFGGGGLLLIGALIALIYAYRRISADQRLLRSYDRLR